MAKGNGLDAFSAKKEGKAAQAKPQKDTSAHSANTAKEKEPERKVITYRISEGDKQLLTVYAATNGTKVQELLNQALKLLAVERDIPLSDEIRKG